MMFFAMCDTSDIITTKDIIGKPTIKDDISLDIFRLFNKLVLGKYIYY